MIDDYSTTTAAATPAIRDRDLDDVASAAPTAPLDCPACGYDLSGTGSFTCSECGYLSIPDDALVAQRRRVYLHESAVKQTALTTAVLAITYGCALFVIRWTNYPIPGWIVFGTATLTLCYAFLFTKMIPLHRRQFTRRLWVANAAFLHIPFYAGIVISVAYLPIDLILPTNHMAVLFVKGIAALLLLTLWGWITGYAFLHWEHLYRDIAHDSWWAQQETVRTVFQRGAFVIYAMNVLLGLATFWGIIMLIVL